MGKGQGPGLWGKVRKLLPLCSYLWLLQGNRQPGSSPGHQQQFEAAGAACDSFSNQTCCELGWAPGFPFLPSAGLVTGSAGLYVSTFWARIWHS